VLITSPTNTATPPTFTPHTSIAVVESLLPHTLIKMVAPEVHHLFHHPIADHSFSADRQTLAVARENNVDLYAKSGSGFKLQDELTGHDKTVTGVDIAPNSGKIVTCSQGN
jgi:WD40 repeat protein